MREKFYFQQNLPHLVGEAYVDLLHAAYVISYGMLHWKKINVDNNTSERASENRVYIASKSET